MSIRRAIIKIVLLVLGVVALLSYAAYVVQKQNEKNAALTLTATTPQSQPPSSRSAIQATSIPIIQNDGIDTDTTPIQYKTVVGPTYSFAVPLQWNSFRETIRSCTAETVTNTSNDSIVVWPDSCAMTGLQYSHISHKDGYSIATNDTDLNTYQHIVDTFTLLPQ